MLLIHLQQGGERIYGTSFDLMEAGGLNPPAPPTCPASTNRVRLPFSRYAAPTDKDAHAIARFRVPPSRPGRGVRSQSVLCPTPCARTDRGCRGRCHKEDSGLLACKPGSVRGGDLSEALAYAKPSAVNPEGRRSASSPPYLTLLPVGFAQPSAHAHAGALLPHRFTLALNGRFAFLWHFPSPLRTPGRYPAQPPVKPGLSSPRSSRGAAAQPAAHKEYTAPEHTLFQDPPSVII